MTTYISNAFRAIFRSIGLMVFGVLDKIFVGNTRPNDEDISDEEVDNRDFLEPLLTPEEHSGYSNYLLGRKWEMMGDYEGAVVSFEYSANKYSYHRAMTKLGKIYLDGAGTVKPNRQLAMKYLRMAAERNDEEAITLRASSEDIQCKNHELTFLVLPLCTTGPMTWRTFSSSANILSSSSRDSNCS